MKKLIISISAVVILGILVISGNFIFARERLQDFKSSFVKSENSTKGEVRGVYSERMDMETYFAPHGTASLEEAYSALGLTIYPEDKVWVFPDPSLGIGSHIDIIRAPILYINDGGTKWIGRSWQETVADYMTEVGLALNPNDEVTPHPGSLIESGMQVSIKRVTKSTFKEEVTVPYSTKYIDDNTLEKGKYETIQNGINGKKEVIYQITTENGKEVDKDIISETILQNVQNKIIARGTKILYKYLNNGSATYVNGYPAMSCAFRGYYGRTLRVTNMSNGKSVIVKVVDWGPAPWTGHYIDLSSDAFSKLAPLGAGIIKNVKVELVLN
ncbi:G5 domain-containing protein [Patescibacteria group bacterium]